MPFIFSFHPKIQFHKVWKSFFPSVLITATIFLLGDALYTHWGVWGFNPDYLSGFYVVNLPVEELLFFFCIPYACVFTYHCISKLAVFDQVNAVHKTVSPVLIISSILGSIIFYDRLYTFAALSGMAFLIVIVHYIFKVKWLSGFYIVYLILLIPFLIVNGILTGTGLDEAIVWYNDQENMGFRILTIPFEDLFYGMSLILMNVFGFEFFKANLSRTGSELNKVAAQGGKLRS